MERSVRAPQAIDAGRILAGVGAIALLVGLFLDWYSSGLRGADDGVSAWTVFEIVDLLLAAVALVSLFALTEGLAAPRTRGPVIPATITAAAALTALVLVTVSLVNEPPAAQDASLEEGIWLSFAGAALMALGALLRNTRIALIVAPRDSRSQPGTAAGTHPEAETETLRPR